MHKLLSLEKNLYNIETLNNMPNSLRKDPLPGIRIKPPISIPSSSDILIGYELYIDDSHYMFVRPNPKKMKKRGWVAVFVALFCFFPATCVPCCLGCCYHETYQRPIYGQPPRCSYHETYQRPMYGPQSPSTQVMENIVLHT